MPLTCLTAFIATAGCSDLFSPATDFAFVGVQPSLTAEDAALYRDLADFQLTVDNVRLVLRHEDGTPALDTVVAILPGQDSVVLDVAVRLNASQELLEAAVSLRSGSTSVFAGIQDIPAKRGGDLTSRPPAIDMSYVGPGADAFSLLVGPSDTTIVAADSVVFRPLALDGDGREVANLAVAWAVRDPNKGSVSSTGVFRPSGGRGDTYVVGRLPTGVRDSTLVSFVPKIQP